MSTPPAKRATPAESAWKADALCRDLTPALFFVDGNSNIQRDEQRTDAKAVCAQCPVEHECLEHAVAFGERWGVGRRRHGAEQRHAYGSAGHRRAPGPGSTGGQRVTARKPNPTPPPCTPGRPRSQVASERVQTRMALQVTLCSLEATPAAEAAREALRALVVALDAELAGGTDG